MTFATPAFCKVEYWSDYLCEWRTGHHGINLMDPEKYQKGLSARAGERPSIPDEVQVIDLDSNITYPVGMERCLLTGRLEEQCETRSRVMGKGKKNKEDLDDAAALEASGKTIVELGRDLLDEYIDELMDEDSMSAMKGKEKERIKGTADGIAQMIALIEKPYSPDVEAVKAKAMDRWEAKNA